jgi:hypothetical protein
MDLQLILPLAIALLAAIFISLPFFTGGKGGPRDESSAAPDPRRERLRELHSRKDSLLSAINDIEFDHGLGKLSTPDYKDLSRKYRAEAAQVLKEIDEASGRSRDAASPDDLEDEIKSKRKKLVLNDYEDEEIEKEILRARESGWGSPDARTCPECGAACGPEDHFCARCGGSLKGGPEDKKLKSV